MKAVNKLDDVVKRFLDEKLVDLTLGELVRSCGLADVDQLSLHAFHHPGIEQSIKQNHVSQREQSHGLQRHEFWVPRTGSHQIDLTARQKLSPPLPPTLFRPSP